MGWRLLGSNFGIKTYWKKIGDQCIVKTVEDVEPLLELNKQECSSGKNDKGEFRHARRIPATIVMEWMTKYGVDAFSNDPWHKKRTTQLLNDPDYKYLRCWNGKL